MKTYYKIILSLIVAVGSFFFLYWILLSIITGNDNISIPVSLFISLLLGLLMYIYLGKTVPGPGIYVYFGGFIIGSLSFIIGYLGPQYFNPASRQGQFLGLFITGPIGFVMGLMAGGLYWLYKMKKNSGDKPT